MACVFKKYFNVNFIYLRILSDHFPWGILKKIVCIFYFSHAQLILFDIITLKWRQLIVKFLFV